MGLIYSGDWRNLIKARKKENTHLMRLMGFDPCPPSAGVSEMLSNTSTCDVILRHPGDECEV